MQVGKDLYKVLYGIKTPEDEETYRLFRNMELRYTDPNSREVITLTIPEGFNPFGYTFDLSECGIIAEHVVITTNLKRFFTVEGENENKVVIGIFIKSLAKKKINYLPDVFKNIVDDWDVDENAALGMFFSWPNRDLFNYLLESRLFDLPLFISNVNLYKNWKRWRPRSRFNVIYNEGPVHWAARFFHVGFLNQN